MKTFLTIIGVIFGVILIALGGFAIYANLWWKDIVFKPDIESIKSKLPSIIANAITNQQLSLTILVDNNNSSGLTIRNFQISGAYKGSNVFQSNVLSIIAIPANAKNYPITFDLKLFASVNTIMLANELIKKSGPTIQVNVSLEKFGMTRDFDFDYQIK